MFCVVLSIWWLNSKDGVDIEKLKLCVWCILFCYKHNEKTNKNYFIENEKTDRLFIKTLRLQELHSSWNLSKPYNIDWYISDKLSTFWNLNSTSPPFNVVRINIF